MPRYLPRIIAIIFLALPLAVIGAIYLALDREPAVRRAAEITPANIQRARQILEQHDPRKGSLSARRSIALSQQDLDLAANYVAHYYANGGARIVLRGNAMELRASLRPPQLPVIFYFNIVATLSGGAPLPRTDELYVGRLPLPGFIGDWLVRQIARRLIGASAYDTVMQALKQTAIGQGQITIAYELPGRIGLKLGAALLTAEESERLRLYQERLVLINSGASGQTASLAELLVATFELAETRSQDNPPAAENRVALLVLAFYINGKSLTLLVPEAKHWPRPKERLITLNGREDLAQHFIVSAALAAHAGSPIADAIGLQKEFADARGGSGFSFSDVAANRAGSRFGKTAVDKVQARNLQQIIRAGISERQIAPATQDLPDMMPDAEFKRRFGGAEGAEFKKMMAEIERRVAALALYRR